MNKKSTPKKKIRISVAKSNTHKGGHPPVKESKKEAPVKEEEKLKPKKK